MITLTSGDETYCIEPWNDNRFIWTSTGYECNGDFATAEEALADAKRHARELEMADEEYTRSAEHQESRMREMMREARREV